MVMFLFFCLNHHNLMSHIWGQLGHLICKIDKAYVSCYREENLLELFIIVQVFTHSQIVNQHAATHSCCFACVCLWELYIFAFSFYLLSAQHSNFFGNQVAKYGTKVLQREQTTYTTDTETHSSNSFQLIRKRVACLIRFCMAVPGLL